MRGFVARGGWLAAAAGLLLSTSPAFAHRLLLTCKIDGPGARVEAFFDDDTPAQEAAVTVESADDRRVVARGQTDERGTWTFNAPPPGSYFVRVSTVGHAASQPLSILPATATPASEPAPPPSREELTRVPWLRVGIGLVVIAGLCGVARATRRWRRPAPGSA